MFLRCASILLLILPVCQAAPARTVLRGHTRPEAIAQNDLGPVGDSFPVDGITLHFKKTPAQQADLDNLLADLQRPGSPQFHRWLTPEQYGERFGLSSADLKRVTAWLEGVGFHVGYHSRGRTHLLLSGTAAHVKTAFGTAIHRYQVKGGIHYANAVDPSLPADLAGMVESIEGLHDFLPRSNAQRRPIAELNSGNSHYLAPDDLAVIYNISPLLQTGMDGTGQKLAIVGQSAIELTDLNLFRTKFGLPAQNLQVMLMPGVKDPGLNSAETEADLDLQWSGAVARNATIYYVYGRDAYAALQYVVDQAIAPVVSASFDYGCEAQNVTFLSTYRTIAQKAAVLGITWLNAAGDSGASGCEAHRATYAQSGLAVDFPASIPEVTAVGGTQFNEGSSTYWSATNSPTFGSALSYIPEQPWNGTTSAGLIGTGGGVSILFQKPYWQAGPGVPADGFRDVPDVSLSASSHDGYYVYSGGFTYIVSGTSASSPVFAGMLALLNQYVTATGLQSAPGLGNINPALYRLAASTPAAFHDVVSGDNAMPCTADSPDCVNGRVGYSATPGYDLASGLGSVDLTTLVHNWSFKPAVQTILSLATDNFPVYPTGSSWNYTLSITEEGGLGSTITDLLIDGVSQASKLTTLFGSTTLKPYGSLSTKIRDAGLSAPVTRTFTFSGTDTNGGKWTQSISVPFLNLPANPQISAVANAASYDTVAAPGMILAVFGKQLAAAPEQAAFVPLLTWMNGFYAYINGILAPIYYISPGQVNVQVPYNVQPGNATLQILNNNGEAFGTFSFKVVAANPGIFADAGGFTVPYAAGSRGQTYTLFITGEGTVSPALATGSAPAASTPLAKLPVPVLPVSMTIGGKACNILFAGIPYGLVGVTQVNFTVPADAPTGQQDVIVTVGTAASKPAKFTVN